MSETNYNNPTINPANVNDRITLSEGNVVSDFDFYPPDFEQTQIERNQPQPDPDLIVGPRAFADTTDNRRAVARKNATPGSSLRGGRVLHR